MLCGALIHGPPNDSRRVLSCGLCFLCKWSLYFIFFPVTNKQIGDVGIRTCGW